MIYVNKIENRITFKVKTGCCLELLTSETRKLLGINKNKITKDENGENVPHLEITEVVFDHFNIVNSNYQHDSRVFNILSKNVMFLKIFSSKFLYIEVWYTDQNYMLLEIEDKIKITLVKN